jgi:hypothetical protein
MKRFLFSAVLLLSLISMTSTEAQTAFLSHWCTPSSYTLDPGGEIQLMCSSYSPVDSRIHYVYSSPTAKSVTMVTGFKTTTYSYDLLKYAPTSNSIMYTTPNNDHVFMLTDQHVVRFESGLLEAYLISK